MSGGWRWSVSPLALLSGSALLATAVLSMARPSEAIGESHREGDAPLAVALGSAVREWASFDPLDAASADLDALVDSLGEARVVILGEMHKDGAAYWAKSRLVRLLHERLGFDVLAWESSFFDVWQLRRELPRIASSAALVARHGITPLWSRAEVLGPLFDYVVATQRTARPLDLFGLDSKCGAIGRADDAGAGAIDEELGPFLRRVASAAPDGGSSLERPIALLEEMVARLDLSGGSSTDAERASDRQSIAAFRRELKRHESALAVRHGVREVAAALHLLDALAAQLEWYAGSSERLDPRQPLLFTNPRDEFMANSLAWYLEHIDPRAKVIVWTGGFHGFCEPDALESRSAIEEGAVERRFDGIDALAELARQRFGAAVRVVGCTTWRGETGSPRGVSYVLPGPSPGSIEAALDAAGARVGSIDLRALPAGHPLRQPQWCSALGLEPARADWSRQLDVLLYSRATFLHSARREAGPAIDRIAADGVRELDGRWPRAAIAAPSVAAPCLAVVEPLASLLEVAGAGAVELRSGLAAVGSLQLRAESQLRVHGELAGDLHASAPLAATVEGPFLGSATALAPSTWRFEGPFAGQLRLHAAATVELRCNLDPASAARVVAKAPGVVVKLAGFTPASRLERIEGAARVELESSDLPAGTQRIGTLEVVVARQE